MRLSAVCGAFAALLCCTACVDIDYRLGENLVPGNQMYNIYTAETPVTEIELRHTESLSGYSSRRITLGAIRDKDFGLSTRACAFTLVPIDKNISFGDDPEFVSFHLSAELDTVSVRDAAQRNIIQNLRVYELARPINTKKDRGGIEDFPHLDKSIVRGTPVINGTDSLSLDFTEEFGKRFLELRSEDLDSAAYFNKFPGIYIEAEEPVGMGGRISIFDLQLNYDSSYGYFDGNFALMQTRGTYDGERKDTMFLFLLGADNFYDKDSLLTNSATGKFPEFALNISKHESVPVLQSAEGNIMVEGGGGNKPVLSAAYLREISQKIIADKIREKGDYPEEAIDDILQDVIINKATLVMPFEVPDNYGLFAQVLSPTLRYTYEDEAAFMSITDATVSEENQGDISKALLCYMPDITYHLQAILDQTEENVNSGNYDIWLMIKAYETLTTNTSTQSINDYNTQLAYQNYYYQMYGGYGGYGYGGYGGGYNDYYSNYYYYNMLNSASASTSSTTTQLMLDQDRYYYTVLNGFNAGRSPSLRLVFSVPMD